MDILILYCKLCLKCYNYIIEIFYQKEGDSVEISRNAIYKAEYERI